MTGPVQDSLIFGIADCPPGNLLDPVESPSDRVPVAVSGCVKLEPNLSDAEAFLGLLDPKGKFSFQAFDDDSERKDPALARQFHGNLKKCQRSLMALNQRRAGIFVCVNETDLMGRKAENVVRVRAVFLDLDEEPLEPVRQAWHAAGRLPQMVVETSPGKYHVYWVVRDVELHEFKAIIKALAAKFNGDPNVATLERVMRLPGFWHQKAEPFRSRIVEIDGTIPAYSRTQVIDGLGLDLQPEPVGSPQKGDDTPTSPENDGKVRKGHRHEHLRSQVMPRLRNAGLIGEPLFQAAWSIVQRDYELTPDFGEREVRALCRWFDGKKAASDSGTQTTDNGQTPVSKIEPISFRALHEMNIPEPRFIIDGFLPEGLTILAGLPKIGKSWIAQAVSIAVASGAMVLGMFRCSPGSVLHLALEDSPRRFKSRMCKMLQGASPPENAYFENKWPPLNPGGRLDGLEFLKQWLDKEANPALIVIDTFAKIRPQAKRSDSVYALDYAETSLLQSLAAKFAVSILCIHHQRKAPSDDPIVSVSGSIGITGAADCIWVLEKKSGDDKKGTLFVAGRDVPERKGVLSFDQETGLWTWEGDFAEVARSNEQKAVLDLLEAEGRPMGLAEIHGVVGGRRSKQATSEKLRKLVDQGRIEKANGQDRYVLTPEYQALRQQGMSRTRCFA